MDSIKCTTCDSSLDDTAFFCFNCGTKIRCESCGNTLHENARFCVHCGLSVTATRPDAAKESNTITYRRTNEGVFCEVSLTDEVGKLGITSILNNLNANKTIDYKLLESPTTDLSAIEDAKSLEVPDNGKYTAITDNQAEEELPHLNDVEMRINCSESEWLAIYAFYLSDLIRRHSVKTNSIISMSLHAVPPSVRRIFRATGKGCSNIIFLPSQTPLLNSSQISWII